MILWKVCSGKRSVLWQRFSEAWEDFKSLDYERRIYPVYISRRKYETLPEFTGW